MSRLGKTVIIVVTLVVAIAIGVADVTTQYLPEITIFVLVPVIAGTYYIGFRYGVFVAITAAAAEIIAHSLLTAEVQYAEVIGDAVSHTFTYVLTAALISSLAGQLRTVGGLERQRTSDLEIAKGVHESVFAAVPERFRDLAIDSKAAFARELGGDYYLITGLDDGLFICIADIAGKGMAAALFSALLHQNVTEALEHSTDLSVLVRRINSRLLPVLPPEMFVTMFCALIGKDRLSFVSAGHTPPLIFSQADGSVKMLQSGKSLPVGIADDLRIEAVTETFLAGDILLAFTDGIIDSPAFRDKPYEKLANILKENAALEPDELVPMIFNEAVPDGLQTLFDDAVVACVKRQG